MNENKVGKDHKLSHHIQSTLYISMGALGESVVLRH